MKKIISLLFLALPFYLMAQQVADTTYNPPIPDPAYEPGAGPIVFVDEGHFNFHNKDGRFKAFANLLERDGYVLEGYKGAFKTDKLSKGKILVISNALNENVEDWSIPEPSAFTKAEIEAVKQWVYNGGSLFLIADHMPFGDAAKDLAKAFGFEFTNGFVFDTRYDWRKSRKPAQFNIEEKSLKENVITNGRNDNEKVSQVASFTGQAFKIPSDASPIIVFDEHYVNLLPDTTWVFEDSTPEIKVEGWSQGAYKKFGKGRIVAFGEAGMFTAQLAGPRKYKMGMSNEHAPENYQLLLNIIHWLDGILD